MSIVINLERVLLMAKYNAIYEGRLPHSILKDAVIRDHVSHIIRVKILVKQVLSSFSNKAFSLFKG